jgi:hypothetical protein
LWPFGIFYGHPRKICQPWCRNNLILEIFSKIGLENHHSTTLVYFLLTWVQASEYLKTVDDAIKECKSGPNSYSYLVDPQNMTTAFPERVIRSGTITIYFGGLWDSGNQNFINFSTIKN